MSDDLRTPGCGYYSCEDQERRADDLLTRAREAARVASIPCGHNQKASYREGFIDGAAWHAAQQATREGIAATEDVDKLAAVIDRALHEWVTTDGANIADRPDYVARALVAHLTKGTNDE